MKKPKFLKLTGFKGDYRTCDIEALQTWLKKTYDFDCLKLYEKCVKSMVDKDYVFKNFDEEMNNNRMKVRIIKMK